MKLLIVSNNRIFEKKYSRFKDEIHIVRQNQEDIKGIIPIIDIYLPEEPSSNSRPWYVIPLATPLKKCGERLSNVESKVSCIADLSEVLINLHSKDIVHRDIKPRNIYYFNNSWAFGDFGLVEYPEKTDLTEKGESVGPRNTIAPEMKRDAINSNGKPADIYSLAKTLWILLTDIQDGFDGQYSHKIQSFSLDNRIKKNSYDGRLFTVTLHKLLESCTSNDPSARSDARAFYSTLLEWIKLNQNYKEQNIMEWEFFLREIIPFTLPEKISWTKPDDIQSILNIISHSNLNHMFFPSGGDGFN